MKFPFLFCLSPQELFQGIQFSTQIELSIYQIQTQKQPIASEHPSYYLQQLNISEPNLQSVSRILSFAE